MASFSNEPTQNVTMISFNSIKVLNRGEKKIKSRLETAYEADLTPFKRDIKQKIVSVDTPSRRRSARKSRDVSLVAKQYANSNLEKTLSKLYQHRTKYLYEHSLTYTLL